jgi:beta-lactamase class A
MPKKDGRRCRRSARRRDSPVAAVHVTGGQRQRPLVPPLTGLVVGAVVVVVLVMASTSVASERPPRIQTRVRASSTIRSHPVARFTPHVDNPFTNASLRGYLRHRVGNITAGVYDVGSGTTYLYRPGVREHTASIIKVDILAALLHQTQASGGLSQRTRGIAQGMIEASDNNDATDLWNLEGGASAVHAFDDEAGMWQTTPSVHWGLTTTTPLDQLKLLRLVMLPNRLLTDSSRVYEYELMRHVIAFDWWGVSAGLGFDAVVALKNGWLPYNGSWQVNSIGAVAGAGRYYLIAVMTDGSPTENYAIQTIQRISTTVWHVLNDRVLLTLS